jgi:exonuclease III
MKILFWNVRGLGGEKGQLKELINKHRVDVFCLQETMKTKFTLPEHTKLDDRQNFSWNWTASQGQSGGTLIGAKQMNWDAEKMNEGKISLVLGSEIERGFSVGKL